MCGEEPGLEEVMAGPEEDRSEKSTPSPCSTRLESVPTPQISDAFVVLWFPGDHSLRLAWVLAPFLKGQSNRTPDGVWDCGGVWPVSCGAQACPHLSPQAPARDSLPDVTLQMFTHPPPKPDLSSPGPSTTTHQSLLPQCGLRDRRKNGY